MQEGDRHEPLPPLATLPGWVWRRTPRVVRVAAAIALLAAVPAVVLAAGTISESKRENAARERVETAAAAKRRVQELRELQRPRSAPLRDGRSALGQLRGAILADARRRHRPRARRVECRAGGAGRFACTAVTSDLPGGAVSRAGVIGFPYRAVVDRRRRRLTWCRAAGIPGEGSLELRRAAALPRACGG